MSFNLLKRLRALLTGKPKLPDTITVRKHVGPWEGTSSVLRGTTDGLHPEFKRPETDEQRFERQRRECAAAEMQYLYPGNMLPDMAVVERALQNVEFESYNLKDVADVYPMHTKADFKPGEFARIFEQVHQARLDKKAEQTPPVPKLTYDETFFHQRNHLDKETARLVINDPELYYWLTGETLEDARAHVQRILADRHVMDADTAEALVDRACEQFRNRTKPEKVLMVVDSLAGMEGIGADVLRRLSEKMPMVLVGAGSGLNFDDEMTKRTLAQFDKIHAIEPMPIVEKPWIEMNQPQHGRRRKKKQSSEARRKRKAGHSDNGF